MTGDANPSAEPAEQPAAGVEHGLLIAQEDLFTDMADPQPRYQLLVEQGYVLLQPGLDTPEALAAHTRREVELWKKVIADAGIPQNQ